MKKCLYLVCASKDDSTEPLKVFFNFQKALVYANGRKDEWPDYTITIYSQTNNEPLAYVQEVKGNEVEINSNTRGGFWAVVVKDGQYYMADLSSTFNRGIEFMVFSSDNAGYVIDWREVFADHPNNTSETTFRKCINKFLHSH